MGESVSFLSFLRDFILCAGILIGAILLTTRIIMFFVDEYVAWETYERNTRKNSYTKISFKRFLTFYNLNPSLWRILDRYAVEFKNFHWFYFGYIDWRRYCEWKEDCRKDSEKKQKLKKDYDNYSYLLKEVQKEIDAVKINTEEQIVESVANMRDITHNLRKKF